MAKKVLFPDDDKYWQHDFFAPLTADPDSEDLSDSADHQKEKMHPVSVVCVSCAKKVKWESAYPESDGDFEDDTEIKKMCSTCWDNHVKDNLLPQIRERSARGRVADPVKTSGKKVSKKKKVSEKKKVSPKKSRSRKKKSRRKKCKCGSTTHLSARSLQCPRNPKSEFYRGPGKIVNLT